MLNLQICGSASLSLELSSLISLGFFADFFYLFVYLYFLCFRKGKEKLKLR